MRNDYIYLERFVWDRKKAQKNLEKHHISFETAVRIFNDPALYAEYDETHSTPEKDRYHCLGRVNEVYTILNVTMTEQDPYIRIISARKATRKEVYEYEQNGKNL